MATEHEKIRRELAHIGRRLISDKLVVGPGGNISARVGGLFYVSPSGYSFDDLEPDQYVGIDIGTGKQVFGDLRPTSEVEMHLACYRRRPDLNALIHTHPPHCIAVASTVGEIPCMFADFAVYVPKLPVLPYVIPTTPRLARAVEAEIGSADSLLLANHGLLTMGRTIKEAYNRTVICEEAARIYVLSRILGEPRTLTRDEVQEIIDLPTEKYRQALMAAPEPAEQKDGA